MSTALLRRWLVWLALAPALAAAAAAGDVPARITAPGQYERSLEHGGLTRSYLLHVPKSYDPARPMQLLLSFHGGGGHMAYQADDARYGQITAAEREGFIAVFPNGYSRLLGRLATWNAGGCCGPAKARDIDDVGFVRAVVAQVQAQLNVDGQRIFATGMSNGAMLVHRLACEMSDTFRAVAAVAGTDNTLSCTPARPVSVLTIHARNDDHARYEGGAGSGSVDRANMANSRSVPETVARWVARDGCRPQPQRVLERPGAWCERYTGCRDGSAVALCVTETGTHSWPGGGKSRSSDPPSQAISANAVMWDFFLGRPLQ